MPKWKNVSVPDAHDWDGDLKALLAANSDDSDATIEVDWANPDEIAARRAQVADAILPALANALQGIADE